MLCKVYIVQTLQSIYFYTCISFLVCLQKIIIEKNVLLVDCLKFPLSVVQVAERALFWWNNEHIVGLIAENRHVILPIIFYALEKNIQNHWNQAINGLSCNVRRMFVEMDSELYERCQRQYEDREARAESLEKKRILTWERLEGVATQVA